MSRITLFFLFLFVLSGAANVGAQENSVHENSSEGYIAVGEKMDVQTVLTGRQIEEKYDGLKPGDTLDMKFQGDVTAVCKKKGCWMKMALEDGREVMVKFKDYAFFVPTDINTGTAIINGKAYVEEMSVEDQRHYAEDAGMTPEEISAIETPKKTLSFIADGVRIKKEL